MHRMDGIQCLSLVGLISLLCISGGQSQICYNCNYYQASSTDPSLQTVLGQLSSQGPNFQQCINFPYYQRDSVPTINCQSLNVSNPPAPFNNLNYPFTGWQCAAQYIQFTLKNYADGNTVQVPAVIRGCVPIQYWSPYDVSGCYSLTDYNNPYVRAITQGLFFPQNNVGLVPEGITGEFCMCWSNYCNSTPKTTAAIFTLMAAIVYTFLL